MEWRIYNELAEANNRTCEIINYFHCPYGDAWHQLLQDGYDAHRLSQHIEWYDNHWNLQTSYTPPASDMKWYHVNEPPITDVTDYDDVARVTGDSIPAEWGSSALGFASEQHYYTEWYHSVHGGSCGQDGTGTSIPDCCEIDESRA